MIITHSLTKILAKTNAFELCIWNEKDTDEQKWNTDRTQQNVDFLMIKSG